MSNFSRLQKGSLLAYKKELQKRFVTVYNESTFFTSRDSGFLSHTEYIGVSNTPIIQVKSIKFNATEDGLKHHTSRYGLMQRLQPIPVYRRGLPFSIKINFNRTYDFNEDSFYLLAHYGPSPSLNNGTKVKLTLSEKSSTDDSWAMWIEELDNASVTVQVLTPSNCMVGLWKLHLISYQANSTLGTSTFDVPEDLFIICNPWNQNDAVFLEDAAEREEYVLNDHGTIYTGTNKEPVPYPWLFSQFDVGILPAALFLLEQSVLSYAARGNPIFLCRAISAVVNSYDDNGLLEGKWEGDFTDGTHPVSWTGSAAIFNEYLRSGQPVKYGQCWVFAGAVTTACRALGIPCRPVTCYLCAHDTDNSLTIDKFFDVNGREIPGGPNGDCWDSTWNFHVWNDVWMSRPDLPAGYGGWQAIDATPQEISFNKYKTGPCSLKAIKEGKVGFQFDTGFLFSEVNADVCHFQEDSTSPWGFTRIKLMSQIIGRRILTQGLSIGANGAREMADITSLYKSEEGTEDERTAVYNAISTNEKAQTYYKSLISRNVRDVYLKLEELKSVSLGDSFTITLSIENHSTVLRTIKANMTASAVTYTGKTVSTISEANINVTVKPKEARKGELVIKPADYMNHVGNNAHFKVIVFASVLETKQNFSVEDDFEIFKSKLGVKVAGAAKVGEMTKVYFSFLNPLAETLTRCELVMEGLGLETPKTIKLSNVGPSSQIRHIESLTPKTPGSRMVVAIFNSEQLSGIKGSTTIMVHPQNHPAMPTAIY